MPSPKKRLKQRPMEYVGALKFPAQEYDLASMPDNERAARDAAAMMPWVRLSALFLRQSDQELEAKVRATGGHEGMNEWVETLEGIGAVLDAKRQDAEMLEAGFTRLLVVIERVIGATEMTRTYSEPADQGGDPRAHLANIRARLQGRTPWRPRLVTGGRS
jgi:hypothetical protein